MRVEEDIRNQINTLVEEFVKLKNEKKKFVPGETFIQYSGDVTSEKELQASIQTLLDGRLAAGKKVETFEKEFASYLKTKHCVSVNSGSAADLLTLNVLTNERLDHPVMKGDEVITSGLSFATAISSVVFNGLIPVFVDSNLSKYTMDVTKLEEAITEKTKAILAVHIFGNVCNMDEIMKIAKKHNLYVIEDCCDSAGSTYDGKQVGSIGDMGTFSFYPAHQMTTMEGGAISTNNDLYSYLLRSVRMWGRALPCPICGNDLSKSCIIKHNLNLDGMEKYDPAYLFLNLGYNSKMVEVQASFGLEQLKRLDEFNRIRKENFREIVKSLRPFSDSLILPEAEEKSDPAWYSIPLTVKTNAKFTREDITNFLRESKIEYRFLFTGNILKQPAFRNINHRIFGNLDNANLTTQNSFFIGCYQGITKEMRDYMIERITWFLEKHKA